MADPLGIAQYIYGASMAVYNYSTEAADAPQSCQLLAQELSSIYGILLKLDPDLARDQIAVPLVTLLEKVQGRVAELLNWLKSIDPENMSRKQRILWPAQRRQKNFDRFLPELERYKSTLTLYLVSESTDARRKGELMWDLEKKLDQEKQQRSRLIDWLTPEGYHYNAKHETSARLRQDGTCERFWTNEEFVQWWTNPGFLWLYGRAGSGKSILASSVVDRLKMQVDTTVIYHYCDFSDTRTTAPETVLRSLLIQLLLSSSTDWLKELSGLVSRMEKCQSPPSSIHELIDLIAKAADGVNRAIIVVDALDECARQDDFLYSLRELADHPGVSIFVTSRREQYIVDVFHGSLTISLEEQILNIKADMIKYISEQLKNMRKYRPEIFSEDLKMEIQNMLAWKADGMFRWVQCQLEDISKCPNPVRVREALQNLPKGLNETYERIIQRILNTNSSAAIAWNILTWLMGSAVPLTLSQLKVAIKIEPHAKKLNEGLAVQNVEHILDICGCFVDAYDLWGSKAVQLSHFTVKEYLESGRWMDSRLTRSHFSPLEVQSNLALLTMSFLLLDDYEKVHTHSGFSPSGALSDSPSQSEQSELSLLSPYALSYWLVHVRQSGEHDDIYELVRSLSTKRNYNLLGRKSTATQVYASVCGSDDESDDFLSFSIQAGIPWMVVHILKDFPQKINANLGDCGSPLIFASRFDCPDVIRALLDIGADINLAAKAHVENLTPFLDDAPVLTPLLMSILVNDLNNFDVLVKKDADIHALIQPSLMWSTLHAAAYSGAYNILNTLLRLGVNPNIVNHRGEAALHIAVLRDNSNIVELLIRAGADPLLQAESGINPLQLVLGQPCSQALDFLLETTQYHGAISPVFDMNRSLQTLQSRSFLPCYSLQHSIVRLRWSGTCEWIMKDEVYMRWRSSHGMLWLHGPSGHGKTVLISTIINNLIIQGDIVLFHYFDERSYSTRVDEFFKGLLIQLLLTVPPRYAENISRSTLNDPQQPSFELPELVRSIIITTATQLRRHVFIIVDALDKYHHRDDLLSYLGELKRIMGVSVLVTTERHGTIKGAYHNLQYLSLAEKRATINLELKGYLSGQLGRYKNFSKFSETLRSEVVDVVLDRADGMFCWFPWLFEALEICQTPQEVNEMLKRLPRYIDSNPFRKTQRLIDRSGADSDNDDLPEIKEEISTPDNDGFFEDICILVPAIDQAAILSLEQASDMPSPTLYDVLPANSVQSYVPLLRDLAKQTLSHKETTQQLVSMCNFHSNSKHAPSGEEQAQILRWLKKLHDCLYQRAKWNMFNTLINYNEICNDLDSLSSTIPLPMRGMLAGLSTQAIRKDVDDLLTMVLEICSSKKGQEAVLWLDCDYAQSVIELMDLLRVQVNPKDQTAWRILANISVQLCARNKLVPNSYKLRPEFITKGRFQPLPGERSKVYRSSYNGVNVAVKAVIDGRRECCQEASILKWLDHPNIVPFLGIDNCDPHLSHLVTLWIEYGNILEYVNKCPEAKPLELVSGIAKGLAFIHDLGISHHKLTSSCILVDEYHQARISDFSFTSLENSPHFEPNQRSMNHDSAWISPEKFSHVFRDSDLEGDLRKADVWSFGIIIYEVFSRKLFGDKDNRGLDAINSIGSPKTWTQLPGLDNDLWDLMQRCWRDDPEERPPMVVVVPVMEMFLNRMSTPIISQTSDPGQSDQYSFRSKSIMPIPASEIVQSESQAQELSYSPVRVTGNMEPTTSATYSFIKKYALFFNSLFFLLLGLYLSRWM